MMRVIANLVSIFSIAFLPWWAASVVLLAFLALFDFFEIIVYGLILDMLYGAPGSPFSRFGFLLGGIALYAIAVFIRPYLKAM